MYSQGVYGVLPEQVVGTGGGIQLPRGQRRQVLVIKDPKLLLKDNNAGKPEGIHLFIGRSPKSAFGTPPATSRCWSTPRR